MNEINNEDIRTILYEISKKIILPKFRNLSDNDIKFKNNVDIVTSVDIEVENKLKNILTNLLLNSLFIGEESFHKNSKILNSYKENQYCWTVDPIDGTNNFAKGLSKFAIMIGLTYRKKIIQSWIYKPLSEEFIYAQSGSGTFINNKKILITKKNIFNKSIGSISSKYWDNNNINEINLIQNYCKKVNSYGCIGFEYINIVKEIRDFAVLSKLYPWDHIPGTLILKEAGGSISHFDNTDYSFFLEKNNLVVANSVILKNHILELINLQRSCNDN